MSQLTVGDKVQTGNKVQKGHAMEIEHKQYEITHNISVNSHRQNINKLENFPWLQKVLLV